MADERLRRILIYTVAQLKIILKDDFDTAILYGSYARGDYDKESDIDIAVLTRCDRMGAKKYTERLAELIMDMNLDYDILLSFCCIPVEEYNLKKDTLPYYRNIDREGVKISA